MKTITTMTALLLLVCFFLILDLSREIGEIQEQNASLKSAFLILQHNLTWEDSLGMAEYRLIVIPLKGGK